MQRGNGAAAAKHSGRGAVCHRWNDVPGHAAHCRLSSLPYLFRTTETIPAQVPYLTADPARIAVWRRVAMPHCRRVSGSAWPGPAARRIRTTAAGPLPLARLRPIREAAPAAFVSLQKPVPARISRRWRHFPGMTDLSTDLTDFGETAAVIENLDLVVTVDTSMGHLAGALAQAGLDHAAQGRRLALDARPERQPLVPHCAAVPAAQAGRLGRAVRPAAIGAEPELAGAVEGVAGDGLTIL